MLTSDLLVTIFSFRLYPNNKEKYTVWPFEAPKIEDNKTISGYTVSPSETGHKILLLDIAHRVSNICFRK